MHPHEVPVVHYILYPQQLWLSGKVMAAGLFAALVAWYQDPEQCVMGADAYISGLA